MSNSRRSDTLIERSILSENTETLAASLGERLDGDPHVAELAEELPPHLWKNTVRSGLRAVGRSLSANPKTAYAGGAVLAGLVGVGVWRLVLSSRNR